RSNTWSAPKGHMEENETERETALRETKEEAGIDAVITEGFLDSIFYRNVMGGEKTVVLFLARAVGTISVRPGEISHFRWVSLEDAKGYLRHASWIEVYEKADAFIRAQLEQ
ncbi:MAG: NUDIX domain-containing protein, partial [Christensenellaceae bacterium]